MGGRGQKKGKDKGDQSLRPLESQAGSGQRSEPSTKQGPEQLAGSAGSRGAWDLPRQRSVDEPRQRPLPLGPGVPS